MSSLVPLDGAVRFFFETKHPLAANEIHGGMMRNKVPSGTIQESVVIFEHGLMPIWIGSRLRGTGWNEYCNIVVGVKKMSRFMNS